jgi:hypothetical protein
MLSCCSVDGWGRWAILLGHNAVGGRVGWLVVVLASLVSADGGGDGSFRSAALAWLT